jgi:hypothetical protein
MKINKLTDPSIIKWIIKDANTTTHPQPPSGTTAPGTTLLVLTPLVISNAAF